MNEIKVIVNNYGRKCLYMRYLDPISGKWVAKSTGCTTMKEAQKVAGRGEAELREGRYKPASRITWAEFRERYETERLPALAANTAKKADGVFNAVEELLGLDRLAKLDTAQVSKFQRLLRDEKKLAEATIKGHLAYLLAALKWAKRNSLLRDLPSFDMPTRSQGGKFMKGRPVTTEEFERILAKTPDHLKWTMRALWLSGLRLSEALDLSWDEPGHIQIDLTQAFPMFVIPGDKQKSGEDQLLPVSPEFSEMLQAVPQDERTGRVCKHGLTGTAASAMNISRKICELGKLAGVVVNHKPVKYASAHDFRRSFGERWAVRVMPAVLQKLMRHKDIETTLRYYIRADGQNAAAEIHSAFQRHFGSSCNTSCNTSAKTADLPAK